MLLEFRVGNFLSFKDIKLFSMVASSDSTNRESHVFSHEKYNLVKSAVIYGANASGKSNLIRAMDFMKWLIFSSSKDTQINESIGVRNFKLSTETENRPSFFEITFICNSSVYRYGFEVSKQRVHSEWLFFIPKRTEARVFTRTEDSISVNRVYFKEGRGLESKTRPNALFLSVVAQFNGQVATMILNWFKGFNIISGLGDEDYLPFTVMRSEENTVFRNSVLQYLQAVDTNITDFGIEKKKFPIAELTTTDEVKKKISKKLNSQDIELVNINTYHTKFDEQLNQISSVLFDFYIEESEGTKKFFGLLGPILDTLENGSVLIIDELDSRLHPLITQFIVTIFNSSDKNPKNAQLIFASHYPNLLSQKFFRRDQIWFTKKDAYGATDLYSLAQFKITGSKVRKDASFQKDYLLGKYGAVPFIGDVELISGITHESK